LARLTREQSQAQTRARLLTSAQALVAREGYENASVDRIAEEAGYSKGAFYSNFSSKEELFLELLEGHAAGDIEELTALVADAPGPEEIIERISKWSGDRARDPTLGLLALELFRRARRDATFSQRHAHLFKTQWDGMGRLLLRLFPEGAAPCDPEMLGGLVMELTYGAASSFTDGPHVDELVRVALTALYLAHGKRAPDAQPAADQRPRAARSASSRG
jgi:AcrR family transcriptional regulator